MTYITLRQFVDDILLLVRNNNISESEDLSREQIRNWVKEYKKFFTKQRLDKIKAQSETIDDLIQASDDIYKKETGPLELEDVKSLDKYPIFTKKTKAKLEGIYNNDEDSILAVHDQMGENIQYMNHIRRHYNYFRKYTEHELTAYYKDGFIFVQGYQDLNKLRNIWVLAIYEDENDDDWNTPSEDDIKLPAWMLPPIKEMIMTKELPFMLGRPSDDSNNSTLASVKPHGPQDDEE